jgi:DNA-binding NarL/FixJ family response regulator
MNSQEAFGHRRAGQWPFPFPELTQREREILELMAQGHSNAYIADHFALSLKTVRNHVSNILAKLGTSTRARPW